MNELESIRPDMVVHARGKGTKTEIGTVAGLKQRRFISLNGRDTPDGKRRYIPISWVETVEGNTVRLDRSSGTVRRNWLDKAALDRLNDQSEIRQQKSIG
jgi:hypothetical protein